MIRHYRPAWLTLAPYAGTIGHHRRSSKSFNLRRSIAGKLVYFVRKFFRQ
jgi:hypothetical protein